MLAVASLLLILVAALLAAHTPALQNSPRCSGALGILVFAAVLAATLLLVSDAYRINFNDINSFVRMDFYDFGICCPTGWRLRCEQSRAFVCPAVGGSHNAASALAGGRRPGGGRRGRQRIDLNHKPVHALAGKIFYI